MWFVLFFSYLMVRVSRYLPSSWPNWGMIQRNPPCAFMATWTCSLHDRKTGGSQTLTRWQKWMVSDSSVLGSLWVGDCLQGLGIEDVTLAPSLRPYRVLVKNGQNATSLIVYQLSNEAGFFLICERNYKLCISDVCPWANWLPRWEFLGGRSCLGHTFSFLNTKCNYGF